MSSTGDLSLLHFRGSRRVKCVRFHSVLPVVAFADKDERVQVWDYECDEVLHEAQLGGPDETSRIELELQMLAEKDPLYFGPSLAEGAQVSKTPTGPVKDLLFCDTESLHWETARQAAMRGAPLPPAAAGAQPCADVLRGSRMLIALCENKVVVMDLLMGSQKDLPRAALETKSPGAMAILRSPASEDSGAPVLCVGCSDGAIRCIQFGPFRLAARLAPPVKSAATCMLAIGGASAAGGDKLISGAADGSLCIWDPLGMGPPVGGGSIRDISPQTSHKAHESAVLSMALLPPRLDHPIPTAGSSLRLVTLGAENRVAIWDLAPFREVFRAKPVPKAALQSVAYASWGQTGQGADAGILLSGGGGPQVHSLRETGDVEKVCDLSSKLATVAKKTVKGGELKVHPAKPHLVALATNVGLALLSFPSTGAPPAVPLKGHGISLDPGTGAGALTQPCYALAHNGELWAVSCRLKHCEQGEVETPEVVQSQPVAKLPGTGRMDLSISSCGRVLAACWPVQKVYALFRNSSGGEAWEKFHDGAAGGVAWDHQGTTFAVVDAPPMPQGKMPMPSKGRRKGGPDSAQLEAALAAAREAAASASKVEIKRVALTANQVEDIEALDVGTSAPQAVHGGALLGVTYRQVLSRNQGGSNAFQFYSWITREPTGEVFPEPWWVRWDSYAELCALGYADEVIVCQCRPRMQRIASLSVSGVSSAAWGTRQLFLSSQDGLDLAFVDRGTSQEENYDASPSSTPELPAPPLLPVLQVIRLAGSAAPPTSNLVSHHLQQCSKVLPQQGMRPYGPLTILGAYGSHLWVVNAWGRPEIVDLSHPSIRVRVQVADGDIDSAKRTASRSLPADGHESAAAFMASMSDRGARQALDLPGVSIRSKLMLSIQAGQLSRAQRYLQALAAGATDHASLKGLMRPSVSSNQSSASPSPLEMTPRSGSPSGLLTPSSRSDDGGDDLLGLDKGQSGGSGSGWGGMLLGAAARKAKGVGTIPYTSNGSVDWDAAATQGPVIREQHSQATSDVAQHALRLVDEALESGDHPVAASCMSLLSKGATNLPSSALLHAVHLRMVQCGMGEEAVALLSRQAALIKSLAASNRDAVLGAALTGEQQLVAQLLQGLAPEASLYNRAWGQADELRQSLSTWNGELGAVTRGTVAVRPN